MLEPRHAGTLLLTGVLLPLLVLVMHPSGHDLANDPHGRMLAVNYLVHGIAIACMPLLLAGLGGLSSWLRWSPAACVAFAAYALASACNLIAATMSGFVAPRLLSADTPMQAAMLHYTHDINQAFAQLAVVAAGAAFVLWGVAMLRRGKPMLAAIGTLVGGALAIGIMAGLLHLDVRGILLVTALQAAWLLPVAVMLRGATASVR